MKVKVEIDLEKDLTIFTLKGAVTVDGLISTVKKYYVETPTKLVMWDFSTGVTNSLSNEDLQRLGEETKKVSNLRIGGKTALVDPIDSHFAILRIYETYRELRGSPIHYFVSRDVDEAMDWLLSENLE